MADCMEGSSGRRRSESTHRQIVLSASGVARQRLHRLLLLRADRKRCRVPCASSLALWVSERDRIVPDEHPRRASAANPPQPIEPRAKQQQDGQRAHRPAREGLREDFRDALADREERSGQPVDQHHQSVEFIEPHDTIFPIGYCKGEKLLME